MDLIIPEWAAPPNIGALSTLRRGGVSRAPFDDGAGGGGLNLGAHVGDRPEDVQQNRALLRAVRCSISRARASCTRDNDAVPVRRFVSSFRNLT